MQRNNSHEFDFVYLGDDGDFKTLHVALAVADGENTRIRLDINSEDEIDNATLTQIVHDIQNTRLKTMRLNLVDDCVITLYVKGAEGRLVDLANA